MVMEAVTKNPGLQHIAEDIFNILEKKSLADCRLVNKSWMTILNRPIFWLKKTKSEHTPENFKSWEMLVHDIEEDQIEKEFVNVLIKMFNQKAMSPLEIFVKLVENKRKFPNTINFILEHVDPESNIDIVVSPSITYNHLMPIHLAAFYGLYEATQKLAYFWYGSNNPNFATNEGFTPIHCAARSGFLDIVKFFVPFTNNPNSATNKGITPIFCAAINGNLETVKFLVGLTDTPLAANDLGRTPIHAAANFGHLETLKFLVELTNTPMAPAEDIQRNTPLHYASSGGHLKIVQFLVTFTKTPNAQNNFGRTSISLARQHGHLKVVEFLEDYIQANFNFFFKINKK